MARQMAENYGNNLDMEDSGGYYQLIDSLQQQVRSLQQQLAVSTWDLQGFMLICAGSPLLVCKIFFRNQINVCCVHIQEYNHFC